jgi:hypothetical protein
MAHWAEIDNDNKVLRVLVGDNNDPAGDEGYQWLIDNLGGTWIKTSYNGNIRKIFAEVGGLYDEENDRFLPAKREGMENFILDEEEYHWVPPIPCPTDGKRYIWSEDEMNWILVEDSV